MQRIDKSEASYSAASPKKHCEDCSMYRSPNGCTLVKGFINPKGTCRFWEAKRAS